MTGTWLPPGPRDSGVALVEVLIASALLLIVIALSFDLLRAGQVAFVTQPEAVDLHQRLRVVSDALTRDLLMAGSGFSRGKVRGSLVGLVAPILPYRTGFRAPDAPGSFFTDRMTLMYVPAGAAEATIGNPIVAPLATVSITPAEGCALTNQACGFQAGAPALVVDDGGRFNLFTVTAVNGNAVSLELRDPWLASMFDPGAHIANVVVASYSLKAVPASGAFQVLQYDGYRSEQPVSDDLVGLHVEYFGDPAPPAMVRQASDPDGPWTTYGPKPPPVGVDDPHDAWPAGENCTFSLVGAVHLPRLAALGGAGDPLVPIGAGLLTDGPWCPDGAAPNRFDADLLRIRRVRITLRAQVMSPGLRGAAGGRFARPGTSPGGGLMVPDAHLVFDVTPRNLNARR